MSALIDAFRAFRAFHNAQLRSLCEEVAHADLHASVVESPSAAEVVSAARHLRRG
jgi:hypothetical protein